MSVQEQIKKYITSQPEPKRSDMRELHQLTLQVSPECKLWFFDGKDSKNHTVSNPTIGYGFHTIKYANGKSRIGKKALIDFKFSMYSIDRASGAS